ncbi:LysR substrate-binding domain-containing protein [Primorskyibacter flagellatus]|nr:LysR substrate-binding domain-containing protein [Primorskyibacter flagellatus]
MVWRLPPLNALRAFEVAARHSSFTRAADELFVTPGAVSRQVRGLEDYLGRPLFDRNYREVVATDASRELAAELFEAFARMDRATRAFVKPDDSTRLKIYAPTTFAMRWFLPRLSRYHAAFPMQEISVESLIRPPQDLQEARIDVAFRLAGTTPNTIAVPLIDINLIPVCSPGYLAQRDIRNPEDLNRCSLLRSRARPNDWTVWCRGYGLPRFDEERTDLVETSTLAYQAARSGAGVAMAIRALVEDDLIAGTLVAPFPEPVRDGSTFHVVYATPSQTDEAVQGLVAWAQEEASRCNDGHRGL